MMEFLLSLWLALFSSPVQAQNTETFQNYMSSRVSASSLAVANQFLALQGGNVRLGAFGSIVTSNLYTPPGTGAGTLSLGTRLNRTLYANDYGAVCDGVTDDHVAFQNAINEAVTLGAELSFNGTCFINVGLTIGGTINFRGENPITAIMICNATISCLSANTTSPVFIHDFQITSLAAAGSGAIITIGATGQQNGSSQIYRMFVGGPNPIRMANAASWVIRDNSITITSATGDGIYMANLTAQDNGSNTAYGNVINSTVAGGNAMHWQSGGGVKIINNVIIGAAFNVGVLIDEQSGIGTSDIWITNNHIEGSQPTGASCIKMQRHGLSTLGNVVITSNECAGWDNAFFMPLDTQWLSGLTLGDNIIGTSGNPAATNFGYQLASPVSMLSIHHGSFLGVSGVNAGNIAVSVSAQTATNCAIGPIPKSQVTTSGALGNSVLSSCTSYVPN